MWCLDPLPMQEIKMERVMPMSGLLVTSALANTRDPRSSHLPSSNNPSYAVPPVLPLTATHLGRWPKVLASADRLLMDSALETDTLS